MGSPEPQMQKKNRSQIGLGCKFFDLILESFYFAWRPVLSIVKLPIEQYAL